MLRSHELRGWGRSTGELEALPAKPRRTTLQWTQQRCRSAALADIAIDIARYMPMAVDTIRETDQTRSKARIAKRAHAGPQTDFLGEAKWTRNAKEIAAELAGDIIIGVHREAPDAATPMDDLLIVDSGQLLRANLCEAETVTGHRWRTRAMVYRGAAEQLEIHGPGRHRIADNETLRIVRQCAQTILFETLAEPVNDTQRSGRLMPGADQRLQRLIEHNGTNHATHGEQSGATHNTTTRKNESGAKEPIREFELRCGFHDYSFATTTVKGRSIEEAFTRALGSIDESDAWQRNSGDAGAPYLLSVHDAKTGEELDVPHPISEAGIIARG